MNCDLLDWIRAELTASQPAALPMVESVLNQARQTFGGDRTYVRAPRPESISRRTLQRRQLTKSPRSRDRLTPPPST